MALTPGHLPSTATLVLPSQSFAVLLPGNLVPSTAHGSFPLLRSQKLFLAQSVWNGLGSPSLPHSVHLL